MIYYNVLHYSQKAAPALVLECYGTCILVPHVEIQIIPLIGKEEVAKSSERPEQEQT
jgi:hypothetical protein